MGKDEKFIEMEAGDEAQPRGVEKVGDYIRVKLPSDKNGEIFGIAERLLGASHIRVQCADGKSRMGRIPGKIKKRMWIREGDLVIVRPWSFQDAKSDIVWRYTRTQASYLGRKGLLPKEINIFG